MPRHDRKPCGAPHPDNLHNTRFAPCGFPVVSTPVVCTVKHIAGQTGPRLHAAATRSNRVLIWRA